MVIGHHQTARPIPIRMRATCRILAGLLSQQIAARQDAEDYEEQIELREREDTFLRSVEGAASIENGLEDNLALLRDMLPADGIAVRLGNLILLDGRTPPQDMVAGLMDWLAVERVADGVVSHHLAREYPEAAAQADTASGLLALALLGGDAGDMILWFRSERIAVINWAGNPHKATDASGRLNPRKSFDLWQETVRQQSLPWSIQEEAAARRVTANLGKLRG
jgi:chemotaxis family two-component system sensor kinase Cph1